jgi:glycosyltransferase involved in cell wall biosynthesis
VSLLYEAIEGVLSQDFPPDEIEIIVVDDGSTDGTPERIQAVGAQTGKRCVRTFAAGQAADPPALIQYAKYYGPQLTWRHQLVVCFDALGALIVGVKHLKRLDEWRIRAEARAAPSSAKK